MLNSQLQLLHKIGNDEKKRLHLFKSGLITPIIQGNVDTFHPKNSNVTSSNDFNWDNMECKLIATVISRVGWRRAGKCIFIYIVCFHFLLNLTYKQT